MATNLQRYTLSHVYVDGVLLAEESSMTVNRQSGAQQVNTVVKGFSGMSPGSEIMQVSIESAVPAAGIEFNPGAKIQRLEPVEFWFYAGEKVMRTKGIVTDDSFSHAVDSPSKISFNATCQYADWE